MGSTSEAPGAALAAPYSWIRPTETAAGVYLV